MADLMDRVTALREALVHAGIDFDDVSDQELAAVKDGLQECGFTLAPIQPAPIDMLLFCPACGHQHVDAPEPGTDWTNPPHMSHKCHACKTIWRPADVPTNGVARISTSGRADSWPANEFQKLTVKPAQPPVPQIAWQPIATAPKDGTYILVRLERGSVEIVHAAYWNSDEHDQWKYQGFDSKDELVGWWSYVTGSVTQEKLDDDRAPTHWAPYNSPMP